jgi:RHS repeat-associated protein
LADHQGTVRDVVRWDDVAGETITVTHFTYDTFGNVTGGDTTQTRYLYTGRDWDSDSGLQYNRARWYDPATGRWISEDPIGFAAGDANLARYVGNSATNAVDPSGLVIAFDTRAEADAFVADLEERGAKDISIYTVDSESLLEDIPSTYVLLSASDSDAIFSYADEHFPIHTKDENGNQEFLHCFTEEDKLTEEQEALVRRRNEFLLAAGIAGPDGRVVDINARPTGYHRRGQLQVLKQKRDLGGTAVVVDIGGEGEHDRAINVNVRTFGTMNAVELGGFIRKKDTKDKRISRLVLRPNCDGGLPFRSKSVDKIFVEGSPLEKGTAAEIARIIRPGGQIELFHPVTAHGDPHQRMIDAIGDRGTASTSIDTSGLFRITIITLK